MNDFHLQDLYDEIQYAIRLQLTEMKCLARDHRSFFSLSLLRLTSEVNALDISKGLPLYSAIIIMFSMLRNLNVYIEATTRTLPIFFDCMWSKLYFLTIFFFHSWQVDTDFSKLHKLSQLELYSCRGIKC